MAIRKNLDVHRDPYLPWGGMRGAARCTRCGAVYRHKRWSLEGTPPASPKETSRSVLCPACRKIRDHFPGGLVMLRGKFLGDHKDQIFRRVHNEEKRAKQVNPLERIIAIEEREGCVEIQTTTERFAQRIGREIRRAFKGEATYRWSRDDKCLRVDWSR